ncbi:MAG: ATP-dependent Clp protease adapter ClpS [Spirochaetaceae bacterium]|jgi:ATP-dependent Clp protease adaptor protein ClpS|nr:ATP-dependent Clp protease adapter ClpS [Spirochaetaceae bacterium]
MAVRTGGGTKFASRQEEKLKEPEEYRVILLNDHYTTMDFVVEILMDIFHKNEEEAYHIMMDVHRKGRGVVGLYPWDIAMTKAEQVHVLARQQEYPLRCIVEQA